MDRTADGTVSADAGGDPYFPVLYLPKKTDFTTKIHDEGYGSKGGLPFFANEEDDNEDEYFEPLLNDGPPAAPPSPPAPAATVLLMVESMMKLNITQLKDKLKKRGQLCAGKKSELLDCLKEAILNNIPVLSVNEPHRPEYMAGLDVMAPSGSAKLPRKSTSFMEERSPSKAGINISH